MSYISKIKLKDATGKTVIANVVDRVAQSSVKTLKNDITEIKTDIAKKYETLTNRFLYNQTSENLTIK